MELKLTHEPICINDVVFDGLLEQPIELDYLLPDYYPNIFKILKCKLDAQCISNRISGDKMVVDGMAYIKMIYICEETNVIKTINQKNPFSKTIDLKYAPEKPNVALKVKSDYVNCRVVNSRKLDVRGVVSIRAKVVDQKQEEIICDATGKGVQVKKRMVNVGGKNLSACKSFTIREDLEIETESGSIGSIIITQTGSSSGEGKIIAGKYVAKGEIYLHTLFTAGDDNNMEIAEHTVPVNQIIDVPELTEDYQCQVRFDVVGIDMDVTSDEGEHYFNAEISICAYVFAFEEKAVQCIDDMFSTSYESSMNSKSMKTEHILEMLNHEIGSAAQLEMPEDTSTIYDVWCTVKNITHKMENSSLILLADVETSVIAMDADNMPILFEKMLTFELPYEVEWNFADIKLDAELSIVSVNKSLSGERLLEIEASFKLEGRIIKSEELNIVTDIIVDENKIKSKDQFSALTIYFADKGERIWDIAKRYNTSVDAILEENDVDITEIENRGMLLIPLID